MGVLGSHFRSRAEHTRGHRNHSKMVSSHRSVTHSSVDRFLQPGVSVNSSTVPYNIAISDRIKKDLACAQNQKNSVDNDR